MTSKFVVVSCRKFGFLASSLKILIYVLKLPDISVDGI